MSHVLLIRHGETEWSRSGQHTSRTDLPLLPAGEAAARALLPRLREYRLALVLASPLRRARDTARLAGFGDQTVVTDDLRELGYGDYEGRTTAAIRAERPGWSVWDDGTPGGESLADAGARADRVLARATGVEGDVALFAHGHILRIVGARWLGLPPSAAAGLALSTASLSLLGHEREPRVIWLWNDTSHRVD